MQIVARIEEPAATRAPAGGDASAREGAPAHPPNVRYALRAADGSEVEAVRYRGDTLCVSSQVGCGVRCPFCASGARGLGRSLDLAELIAQVDAVASVDARPLRRVTVSGVGEPLHNAAAIAAFVDAMRRRGIAVSLTTSGGAADGARLRWALAELPHRGLTLSVHAGTEPVRARLVPHAPTLSTLRAALEATLPALTAARRKKTALAYLLIAGENDADAELDAFAAWARPFGLAVHLYAMNAVPTSALRPATRAAYERAYARLSAPAEDGGRLRVRMSCRARTDPNGGCGTLVALRRRPPQRQ
jgi:23S rRNA (adenine2503-C2)-methyltransferase